MEEILEKVRKLYGETKLSDLGKTTLLKQEAALEVHQAFKNYFGDGLGNFIMIRYAQGLYTKAYLLGGVDNWIEKYTIEFIQGWVN